MALVTAAGCTSSHPGGTANLPGLPTAKIARKELAGLTVAPQGTMSGYSRAMFPHWAEQGAHCYTREKVLERDGTGVQHDAECRARSGRWTSAYDGKVLTSAAQVDIDHTVPLANAWRSGASTWTQEQRTKFANDLTHPQLAAVSADSNRAKGDQSPDQWAPPLHSYWCAYARSWVSVKATYQLTVTTAEENRLTEMLDTCTA
ncbi:HNH endonuclease family protein [Streptomyces monashensis]